MFDRSLTLPCGAVLKNRLVKAAMSDGLAERGQASEDQVRLYRRWAEGGAGLIMIGEAQVDRRFPERPGNLLLDGAGDLTALRALTAAGRRNGAHFWAQLGHAGALTFSAINCRPLAPSSLTVGRNRTRAMTGREIEAVIEAYGRAASIARDGGFSGVEIHAAHGFLLSQFLSPRFNRRNDDWGGTLEKRARLLLEVIRTVRRQVGRDFPIGVKLNSADFSKGGFSMAESRQVAAWLDGEAIDLLEISGGTYEIEESGETEETGETEDTGAGELWPASSSAREAFFLDFAASIRTLFRKPLLVTGGFRSRRGMTAALGEGACDLIGVARPLAVETDLPNRLLSGQAESAKPVEKGFPASLPPGANTAWYGVQLIRQARGQAPDFDLAPADALALYERFDRERAVSLRP